MKKSFWVGVLVALGVGLPATLAAEPTATETCRKMIAEGRNGPLTFNKCLCAHDQAGKVLDPDIRALLLDSWHTGKNNMKALEALPRPARVERQMTQFYKKLTRTCDVPP